MSAAPPLTHPFNSVEKMSDWPLDLDGVNPVPVPEITAENSELYRVVSQSFYVFVNFQSLIQLLRLHSSHNPLGLFFSVRTVSACSIYKSEPTYSPNIRNTKIQTNILILFYAPNRQKCPISDI